MLSVGLFGCGQIGQSILSTLASKPIDGISIDVICCRESQAQIAQSLWPQATVLHDTWSAYTGKAPDIVIEAAGQTAAAESGESILASGSDLYLLSVGVLAHQESHTRLLQAANEGNSRLIIPSGALAGFDGLHTLRHAGLDSVVYRSTKPPAAWKGTLAETLIDLDNVQGEVTFFRGHAADAALQFPRNANLAAAVALAGVGFERTQVELVASTKVSGNQGEILAVGTNGSLEVKMAGQGFKGNPKSSQSTAMSVVAALQSRASRFAFAS